MMTREAIIDHARKTLADWREKGASPKAYLPTNTMRKKEKAYAHSLGLSGLKSILSIDKVNETAWIEPGVTMQALVDATLPCGFVPLIVPEFKSITVGGAINGAALESSSHLHGQFNDICLEYEVLLADGSIVKASPEDNRELFYGIASSYGTLGFLLKVKIKLQKTTGWMGLHYSCFEDITDAIGFMKKIHLQKEEVIEGIVFHPKKTMVMWGSEVASSLKLNTHSMKEPWSKWFYSHCDEVKDGHYEAIPIKDYLFRHDRGAFWMAGYSLHFPVISAYIAHKAGLPHKKLEHAIPKNPGPIFRSLFGWMTDSQKLYKSLHGGSEKWFEEHLAIQDFYLPESTVKEFVDFVLQGYKITPLWLCPIAPTKTPQLFSPHQQDSELLFDVGVYGLPYNSSGKDAVRAMEKQAYKLNGKKMFYAYSYLPKEEFWSYYPEKEYKELRDKYSLDGIIPDITEKVLN